MENPQIPYYLLIAASFVIILSYFFNLFSYKTKFPSVILLIGLGVLIKYLLKSFGIESIDWMPILELLGIMGLIMIVLEAALDLELTKEKIPLIIKSTAVAIITLGIGTVVISTIFHYLLEMRWLSSAIYAVPLSIMSSAIIIPSVEPLEKRKKEFMIYESTISDILGIIVFYFLVDRNSAVDTSVFAWEYAFNILLSIIISIVISFGLVFLFQNVQTKIRLFLIIAILVLLYSAGKVFHISSLMVILIFGIVLQNRRIAFIGPLKKRINFSNLDGFYKDLYLITIESSFLIRTFFFVIFGAILSLESVIVPGTLLIGILIICAIYLIRIASLTMILGKDQFPEVFLSPRGLITVLLYFAIPVSMQNEKVSPGILFVVIIISSLLMAIGLVTYKRPKAS